MKLEEIKYKYFITKNFIKNARIQNKRYIWLGIGSLATYKLFDAGLANTLALTTLAHGTGPKGYWGIHLRGADPELGGDSKGSGMFLSECYKHGLQHPVFQKHPDLKNELQKFAEIADSFPQSSRKHFFVIADRSLDSFSDNHYFSDQLSFVFSPRMHAILSSMAYMNPFETSHRAKLITNLVLGAITGLCIPILKFKFNTETLLSNKKPHFERDPDHLNAFKTKDSISPLHLGITGSILKGLDRNTPQRIKEHPLQVLMGTTLLATSFLVGRKTYRSFMTPAKEIVPFAPISYSTRFLRCISRVVQRTLWRGMALSALFI